MQICCSAGAQSQKREQARASAKHSQLGQKLRRFAGISCWPDQCVDMHYVECIFSIFSLSNKERYSVFQASVFFEYSYQSFSLLN